MGLMESAAERLDRKREECLSVPIIYLLKDGSSLELTATIGRTLFRAENEYGVTIRVESRDFLTSTGKLSATPQRGDRIIYAGRRYEVLAPNSEPVWRWSGTGQLVRRIHTKEIGGV
jgi:hypothetical protein